MSHDFFIVDVFAERKYAGNQLAVVTGAGDLDGGEMQTIAAEFGYSETTFVTGRPTDSGWPVRIFTPEAEVPFAGHPTLGTAAVVRRELAEEPGETVTLDLEAGEIPVRVRGDDGTERLWMHQNEPTFGEELPAGRLAAVLGLDRGAVGESGPIQVVSTGLPAVVVPVAGRGALSAIDVDRGAYEGVVEEYGVEVILAVCAEPRTESNDLAVRVFAPGLGVPEDPATGSANGCLAAYLSRHAFLGGGDVAVRVEQGYEMGRPSLLCLEATARGRDVDVGGSVVAVAGGELY